VEENRGQEVISRKQLEKLKWYGCIERKEMKAVYPIKGNVPPCCA